MFSCGSGLFDALLFRKCKTVSLVNIEKVVSQRLSFKFGFAGNVFILVIYLLLAISIMWISFRVQSRFAQLTCIGIAMTVFFYMFVNVAMVTGLLPVVGAPLPFISYGGTSMLTLFVAFGIVASAIVHDRRET